MAATGVAEDGAVSPAVGAPVDTAWPWERPRPDMATPVVPFAVEMSPVVVAREDAAGGRTRNVDDGRPAGLETAFGTATGRPARLTNKVPN